MLLSFVKGDIVNSKPLDEKTVIVHGKRYFWYVDYKCVDSKGGGIRAAADADANIVLDSDNDGVPDYIDSDSDGGRWLVLCLK